jgi:hypothetical protein
MEQPGQVAPEPNRENVPIIGGAVVGVYVGFVGDVLIEDGDTLGLTGRMTMRSGVAHYGSLTKRKWNHKIDGLR